MTRAEQAFKSCQPSSNQALVCARALEQELENLDNYRPECATRDSAQELRYKLRLAVLNLYLRAARQDLAQTWFRRHFSVRPPTSNDLFTGGPRLSDFVSQQLTAQSRQGVRKVHFEVAKSCMIFVNGTEVDRDVLLPLGTYEVYTVNPSSLSMSSLQNLELSGALEPMTVPLECSVSAKSVLSKPRPQVERPKPAGPSKHTAETAKVNTKPPIQSDPGVHAPHTIKSTHEVKPSAQASPRLLPIGYEIAGLTAGLLGVAGGLIALPYHGECREWLTTPTGSTCVNNKAWTTRPQSWVAIGIGSGVAATSLTLLIIDLLRTKRASRAQALRAWRVRRGQVWF